MRDRVTIEPNVAAPRNTKTASVSQARLRIWPSFSALTMPLSTGLSSHATLRFENAINARKRAASKYPKTCSRPNSRRSLSSKLPLGLRAGIGSRSNMRLASAPSAKGKGAEVEAWRCVWPCVWLSRT